MKFKIKISEPDDGGNDASEVRITRRIEFNFWRTCLLTSAGLLLAWLICGDDLIRFGNFFYFAALVITIWFLNWIIRPILVVFTLPFIIFTMGVGMLFINAFIIYIAARLLPSDEIFVASYWVALLASFFASFFAWALALAQSEKNIRRAWNTKHNGDKRDDDDVIDV